MTVNAKIGAAVHPIVVNVEGKDHRHPEVEAAQTTI